MAFAILIGLGVWQLRRLAWKESLLAQLSAAERAAPIPLGPAPTPFSKVVVSGTLRDVGLYAVAVHSTPAGLREGGFRLGLLDRPDAPPVLINEGWVPDALAANRTPRPARIVGYVQPSEPPGPFTPHHDPITGRVYAPDPARIARDLHLPPVAPFIVVALGSVPPGTFPRPVRHLPRPPNNHLQYALTWFGLAAVLAGVFGTFAAQRLSTEG